ncbi:hypothetical protein [Pontibacillus sp. HMF3514]|uniref:hypothetical protein n=1 Tax=Pontibacillus sp. HMF3514 TaxID=2692425 RepID=UPI00351BD120
MNPLAKDMRCRACDGSGLLMDDEEWRYTCTICGGSGELIAGKPIEQDGNFEVDEMNRTLE